MAQRSEHQPASIQGVPDDVLIDALLPHLTVDTIESLSQTNHRLYSVATSESFWRQKIKDDFHFRGEELDLSKVSGGWSKRLWHGLRQPRVYVWGSSGNSRLGLERGDSRLHVSSTRGVPFPAEISSVFEIPKSSLKRPIDPMGSHEHNPGDDVMIRIGIVDLQAGGWSFTARDFEGGIWVWGQLDGLALNFRSPNWRDKHTLCSRPSRLPLPCRAESMSAGRRHLLVLDSDNLIWEMRSWGRAFYHTASSLTSPENPGSGSRPPHVLQVSSGWSHSACLTSHGSVFVWYPFTAAFDATLTDEENLAGPLTQNLSEHAPSEGHIQIRYGRVGEDVIFNAPSVPSRPKVSRESDEIRPGHDQQWAEWESSRTERSLEAGARIVKIASGDSFVLALRANGEVWLAPLQEGQAPIVWEYLPHFSFPGMTHITAQFRTFTVYSATSVLIGHVELANPLGQNFAQALKPDIIPELQNADIIRLACGDYHNAALNSSGEMFTWGSSSQGALGLNNGDSTVTTPRKVEFGKGDESGSKGTKEPFVFAITAGGWHTGALVLHGPRESSTPEEAEGNDRAAPDLPSLMPGGFPNHPRHIPGSAGGGLGAPYFRVGFAGRGRFPPGPTGDAN